jgi:ribosomal protein S12 methylthiotransferase accessory factor
VGEKTNDLQLKPRLKPWFRCETIPGGAVVLLSERGHSLLEGQLYLRLIPLLDGDHTVEEIVECLKDDVPPTHVFYAIETLRRRGYVTDRDLPLPAEVAAFWDILGIEADIAAKSLQESAICVFSCGDIDLEPLRRLLSSCGVRIDDHADRWIVFTDDYLHGGLRTFNQEALKRRRPWLLIKPVGSELYLGPLFVPGKTGCWDCLAHRLRGSHMVETYLQAVNKTTDEFSVRPASLHSTIQTGFSIAATEIAEWVICGQNEHLEDRIVTLNTRSLTMQNHVLVRRPQCPSCGDSQALIDSQSVPLVLQSRRKHFIEDGGHRSCTPQETLAKLEHHVSWLSGIVSSLRPTFAWTGEHSPVPSYITRHNFVEIFNGESLGVDFLRSGLQTGAAGKGKYPAQAKASALCESLERYSGVFQGDEFRIRASYTDLGSAAIHVNDCMLFSNQQFTNRQRWNEAGPLSNWVPLPFDTNAEIEWSPVWSLTFNVSRYVPTAYCYYGYSQRCSAWFARADSNGCAAGHSKEEAILQGFMELAERDSVALWWYNRLRRPAVDLSGFKEPFFQELHTYYGALHRDLWVLDLTSDLNIPCFAAISRRNDKSTEDIILGFGAHFDARIAILRALTEVNQSLPAVYSGTPDLTDPNIDHDPAAINWWKIATIENQPYLLPDKSQMPKTQKDFSQHWSDDFLVDVMSCVRIAQENGLETLVLDQTRPDVGLHAVKVLVPGLRHFWPRFAPGRLYEVPVKLGWLGKPLTEEQLNTQRIYF